MTVFADASALIAILADEPDADALMARLLLYETRLVSPLSLWETVSGLRRSQQIEVAMARSAVDDFMILVGLRFASLGQAEFELAAEAYARFGKGRHPAALNMGDCFAYGCARSHKAKLLFKGDDFGKTDIAAA